MPVKWSVEYLQDAERQLEHDTDFEQAFCADSIADDPTESHWAEEVLRTYVQNVGIGHHLCICILVVCRILG